MTSLLDMRMRRAGLEIAVQQLHRDRDGSLSLFSTYRLAPFRTPKDHFQKN